MKVKTFKEIHNMNDREKHIASLITQLSEYANDESTTQGTIDKIISEIQRETKENAKEEMDKVKRMAENMNESVVPKDGMENQFDVDKLNPQGMSGVSMERKYMQPIQNSIIFTRIREVKKPGKAHPTDAGIDFYVPDEKAWDDDFKEKVIKYSRNSDADAIQFVDGKLTVEPNSHVAIPSGIKTIIPQGFGMMMVNKSGVATKMKLDHSACLIDSEYRDELIFCFFNHSVSPVSIEPEMKITQGLIVPIINFPLDEVVNRTYEDMGKDTNRGGGFGSSGNT